MRHTLFLFFCFTSCSCSAVPVSIMAFEPDQPLREPIDSIVILKSQRQMQVYHRERMLKAYRVCLGPQPVGAKHFRNDGKTPEGLYYINGKNPNSHYHKALGVSYPSPADMRYAKQHGKPTGGDIKIHGLPNAYEHAADETVTDDWTLGCVAVNDEEIDELYGHVAAGTPVNILP
jgi:murein L,D-transpeptidase YafK